MEDHIAIITVLYNNYTILDNFINSLRLQSDKNFHLYIADASLNKKNINFSDIKPAVIPVENKGYAHGVNEGLKQAVNDGFKYFCVINTDVYFQKEFVSELRKEFKTRPSSIFGGKIYYASGYEYHKNRYSKKDLGHVLWYAGGKNNWNHATTSHRGVDNLDIGQFDKDEKTDFISGCLMCFDSSVLNTNGFWDEQYFLYYEDADYCERAKKNNISLWYIPKIQIWHKNAQSTDGSGSVLHERFQKTSHLRFALKYAPLKTKIHVLKNFIFR